MTTGRGVARRKYVDFNEEISSADSFEDLANKCVQACARIAGAATCTLWRVYVDEKNNKRLRLAAAYGVEAPRTLATEITYAVQSRSESGSRFDGITGYVATKRVSVLVNSFKDLQRKYSFCWRGKMDNIQWKGEPQNRMRNLYAVPLLLGDDLQGVLKVENRTGGPFTEEDTAKVDLLTERIALATKTFVLLDSHDRQLIDAPAKLSRSLVRPFETTQLAQHIVDVTANVLNAQVCSLWLVDDSATILKHQANFGFRGQAVQIPTYRIDVAPERDTEIEGITAWVAIRKRPFWANSHEELRKHPSWRGTWDPVMYGGKPIAETRFHSMYAVPLVWNNELLGVLKVENPKNAQHFGPNDRLMCDIMANYIVLLLVLTRQLRLQLLPSMAHTLNSPAAGIAMLLAEFDRELSKAAPDLQWLKEHVETAKRWTFTIAVMGRTLSAEVAARVATHRPEHIDLVQFLHNQCAKIRKFTPAHIRLELVDALKKYDLPLNPSEQVWIEIIVFNLLHNAVKYSPHAGRVTLSCNKHKRNISISVADEGSGISDEHKKRIFDPHFVGTKPPGWPQGTGLGLYEVHRLVHQLGWSIVAGDNHPRGANFEITIPLSWRSDHDKS